MSASAGDAGGPVVVADAVSRTYRAGRSTLPAVEQASLAVRAGEVVGITGPSGCGKSTLLRLLAGLERPDRGVVHYGGQAAWSSRRARFATHPRPGYVMPVFQDPFSSVDPRWPIWRIVTEPLTGRGREREPASGRRRAAARWLARADLGHLSPETRPGELSGGQCQRLALVRALVAEPALMVADEPTARQDVITAAAMTRLLRQTADGGVGMVVVSHDRTWLATLADRVVPMAAGRLLPA